jgi:hypothetical protein
MKSDLENPPKILRRPHYQKNTNKTPKKSPTKYQKITNNHQKSPSFPHEIQSRKSPKNTKNPPLTRITKKSPTKHQKSPKINNKNQITNFQIKELKETEKKTKKKNP